MVVDSLLKIVQHPLHMNIQEGTSNLTAIRNNSYCIKILQLEFWSCYWQATNKTTQSQPRLPVRPHDRVVQVPEQPRLVRRKEPRVQLIEHQPQVRVCLVIMTGVVAENKRTKIESRSREYVTCRCTSQSCIYQWTCRAPRGRRSPPWSGQAPALSPCYARSILVGGTFEIS